jgi:hypothetical protein
MGANTEKPELAVLRDINLGAEVAIRLAKNVASQQRKDVSISF